jgi:mannose-1-phosphate guanylyltransferase
VRALILAAGEGRRLRPLTQTCPKPLLPLGQGSTLEHSLGLLRRHGVDEVAINLHHLAEAIPARLGDGQAAGVRITYVREETLRGSAGTAKSLGAFLDDTFFVLYGDVLTDIDLDELAERHVSSGAVATIALQEVDDPSRCGIAELDDDDRVVGFVEKPARGEAAGNLANVGVYCLEPEALAVVGRGETADFGRDVFPRLLARGRHVAGFRTGSYVLDIGSPERYEQARRDLRSGRFVPAWGEPAVAEVERC